MNSVIEAVAERFAGLSVVLDCYNQGYHQFTSEGVLSESTITQDKKKRKTCWFTWQPISFCRLEIIGAV